MKIHLKYTPKGDDICKDIVLDLVDRVLEENRSDVEIEYDEDDVQETPAIKRKCYEIEALRKKLIEQRQNSSRSRHLQKYLMKESWMKVH